MISKKKTVAGELIYGIHPIVELLKARKRKLISLYTVRSEPKGWQHIKQVWPDYHVPIQYVAREVLTKMSATSDHQGFVAWTESCNYRKKMFSAEKAPFVVLLDGIQDPRNVGAILRSAYCARVDGVIITQKHSAPLNAVSVKSAAGLSEHLDILMVPSIEYAINELAKAGYNVYTTTFGGMNALTAEYKSPLCVVLGSEGHGVSKMLLNYGTQVTIPQRSADISYNVSVAAGIMLVTIASKIHRL
jgi:23S rRNA (guanosine2251-2'-O)-methyltransferase